MPCPYNAQPGAYFVTICTYHRECPLGDIVDGDVRLNEAGETVRRCWEDIPHHFPLVQLDAMVIMPNHVHGIIVITESSRLGRGREQPETPIAIGAKSLSSVLSSK